MITIIIITIMIITIIIIIIVSLIGSALSRRFSFLAGGECGTATGASAGRCLWRGKPGRKVRRTAPPRSRPLGAAGAHRARPARCRRRRAAAAAAFAVGRIAPLPRAASPAALPRSVGRCPSPSLGCDAGAGPQRGIAARWSLPGTAARGALGSERGQSSPSPRRAICWSDTTAVEGRLRASTTNPWDVIVGVAMTRGGSHAEVAVLLAAAGGTPAVAGVRSETTTAALPKSSRRKMRGSVNSWRKCVAAVRSCPSPIPTRRRDQIGRVTGSVECAILAPTGHRDQLAFVARRRKERPFQQAADTWHIRALPRRLVPRPLAFPCPRVRRWSSHRHQLHLHRISLPAHLRVQPHIGFLPLQRLHRRPLPFLALRVQFPRRPLRLPLPPARRKGQRRSSLSKAALMPYSRHAHRSPPTRTARRRWRMLTPKSSKHGLNSPMRNLSRLHCAAPWARSQLRATHSSVLNRKPPSSSSRWWRPLRRTTPQPPKQPPAACNCLRRRRPRLVQLGGTSTSTTSSAPSQASRGPRFARLARPVALPGQGGSITPCAVVPPPHSPRCSLSARSYPRSHLPPRLQLQAQPQRPLKPHPSVPLQPQGRFTVPPSARQSPRPPPCSLLHPRPDLSPHRRRRQLTSTLPHPSTLAPPRRPPSPLHLTFTGSRRYSSTATARRMLGRLSPHRRSSNLPQLRFRLSSRRSQRRRPTVFPSLLHHHCRRRNPPKSCHRSLTPSARRCKSVWEPLKGRPDPNKPSRPLQYTTRRNKSTPPPPQPLCRGGAAAAPLPPAPPAPLAALELAVGGEADPTAADSGHDAGTSGRSHLPAARADDSMGGGADDTIVGKRPIAALQAARAIAAKAKARV